LKFRCPNCSQKLTAKENVAGCIRVCPRCKRKITVPEPSSPASLPDRSSNDNPADLSKPLDNGLLNLTPAPEETEKKEDTRQREEELLASFHSETPPEHTGQRRMIWPLDILLYPTSVSGLTTLGIMVGLTFLLPFVGLLPFMDLILLIIMVLYFGWYLAECVYDSTKGGTRAPEVLTPGLGGMWSRVSYLVATHVLFALPLVIYSLFAREADFVFYGLLIWTILFFPMGLLAMAIMDSTTALNPFVLLGAIFRTFFSYIGLLVLLVAVTFLMGWLWNTLTSFGPALLSTLIGGTGFYYTMMVQAHVLGRFYWRNRERLDWGI